jgi:hypothetical protein
MLSSDTRSHMILVPLAGTAGTQDRSCGIYGEQRGIGAGFLRELRFPLPIYIPSALHNHINYHPRLAQLARCGRSANSIKKKKKKIK